jgi:NAD(P)H-quinone oxidoreductase subunit 5
MIVMAFMAATQLAAGLLDKPLTSSRVLGALLVGCGAGGLYGLNIRLIETALVSLHDKPAQPMDGVYFAGSALIFLVWMAMILDLPARLQSRASWKRLYMAGLNASQPHPQSVTAIRTAYQV